VSDTRTEDRHALIALALYGPLSPLAWSGLAAQLNASGTSVGEFLADPSPDPSLFDGVRALSFQKHREARQRLANLGFELAERERIGLNVLTLLDEDYPARLRRILGDRSPPLLFVAGDRSTLDSASMAVAGSRAADEASLAWTRDVAEEASGREHPVVTGLAAGVDTAAASQALEAGGRVVGVPGDSLRAVLRRGEAPALVLDGRLTLLSPHHPDAPFSVGRAMARNSVIYALARAGVIPISGVSGGTWTGATEVLKRGAPPLFVREIGGQDNGNAALIARGAITLPCTPARDGHSPLWEALSREPSCTPRQGDLFSGPDPAP